MGLGDALNHIGKKAMICLREPALGPVFGMKGGAAGGGYSQVVPMEDINLHFTGDFAAIGLANNLLAALIDNHIYHGNELGFDVRRIAWRRVLDVNDRALRMMTIGLGAPKNGYPREDGFDIVVASEVMAIFCLCTSLNDLKERLGSIVVGYTRAQQPIHARDLHAHGAMTVLLQHALAPNLVQTLENNPAFIHGGPFANIAHGCNSVIATRAALKLCDYVVTEAGFGADLGAEKFVDIKCRKAGLTSGGGGDRRDRARVEISRRRGSRGGRPENVAAVEAGSQISSATSRMCGTAMAFACVVAINHRAEDTGAEMRAVVERTGASGRQGAPGAAFRARRPRCGGCGARSRAALRCSPTTSNSSTRRARPLWEKMHAIATRVYGAADISATSSVRAQIERLQNQATVTIRCAWRRPSIPSPPTRRCAARLPGTSSMSAKCGSPPARNSSS